MTEASDRELLERIKKLLKGGLKTTTAPIPEDSSQYEAIVAQLADLPSNNLEQKLIISGYVDHPVDEMRCLECMYYLRHRMWCHLPEIDLPAESDWWCRLWRI